MKPIYTLIIESSTTMPAVALSCNGQIQSQLNLTPGFSSSQELIPKLMDLLAGENVQVSDISYIGVGVGPGSYTGIRVGVSVAQCLAYALSLPLCGICSLKAFVPSENGRFAVLFDAKVAGVYYLGGFCSEEGIIWDEEPQVCSLEECAHLLENVDAVIGPDIQKVKKRMATHAISDSLMWVQKEPQLEEMQREVAKNFAQGDYSLDGKLEILYLRKTQAELERDAVT
ncbi:MAG: tRNA (adenosine(37)-N6)-threonylcarbamoyltransferase complex dimerization subunit type 1 TsaB [Waddliaceae bacterium]|nr:tRNA (adenosine(37)-N6)-threonylcarbamoyltransferase complex dimerization subunit type 1 TsaB [Waddliaceae bacterium]